jgi:hypothetical protein
MIAGTADRLEVGRLAEPSSITKAGAHVGTVVDSNACNGAAANRNAHVGTSTKLDAAIVRTQIKDALVGLGWKSAIAQAAAAAAFAALGTEATLERLIFEALRRCPKPTS